MSSTGGEPIADNNAVTSFMNKSFFMTSTEHSTGLDPNFDGDGFGLY